MSQSRTEVWNFTAVGDACHMMSGFNNTALVDLVTSSRKMFPVPIGDATSSTSTLSSSNAQLRKIKKPLIEKRRRERINECLVQLKALVLEAMNKDGSQYSKMEKADILEMTVAHLKSLCGSGRLQQQLSTPSQSAVSPSSAVNTHSMASRYVSGYTECAREVANYLTGLGASVAPTFPPPAQGDTVRRGLLNHLESCLQRQVSCPDQQRTAANFSPVSADSNHASDDFHSSSSKQWVPTSTSDSSAYRRSAVRSGCGSPSEAEMDRLSYADVEDAAPVSSGGSRLTSTSSSSGVEYGRSRCDSGVYSGASSPADDSVMSPQSNASSSPMEEQTNPLPLSDDCNLSYGGRCGSQMPRTYFSGCYNYAEDVAKVLAQRQRLSPLTDYNHNVVSFDASHSQVLNLTTKNDDVWRPW